MLFTCTYYSDISEEYDSESDALEAGWRRGNNNEWYSPSAMENGTFCEGCGCYINYENDSYESNVDGDDCYWCDDCFYNEGGYYCERCECTHWSENSERTDVKVYYTNGNSGTEVWCEECARQDAEWNEDEERYEYYCRDRNTTQQSIIKKHPDGWKQECCEYCTAGGCYQRGNCEKCLKAQAENKELKETSLWVYDTRFSMHFYHPGDHVQFKETIYRKKGEHPFLYYGIEHEVQFDPFKTSERDLPEIAKTFIEIMKGRCVSESDSSIFGIEFIYRPMSYNTIIDPEFRQDLKKGYQYLISKGAIIKQPENAGIHIHMSRKFFERNTKKNPDEINKDLDWVFQYYQQEIEKVSQRKYTIYCQSKAENVSRFLRFSNVGVLESGISLKAELTKSPLILGDRGGDYHHAVIAMRNQTIEVRSFKSTLDPNELLSYVQFVRNIAHTVRNKDITKITFQDLLDAKDSPELDEYIRKLKKNKDFKTDKKIKDKIELEVKIG